MDFSQFKNKVSQFKDKAIELKNKTVDMTVQKISESNLMLIWKSDLEKFILKSENKKFINDEWIEKIYTKRIFVVFWNSKETFFKNFMLWVPVLLTKSFSQNISFKIVDISNKENDIDYSQYGITEFPALVIFENKEIYKLIFWEEKLNKVVKSFTLDINQTIDEL